MPVTETWMYDRYKKRTPRNSNPAGRRFGNRANAANCTAQGAIEKREKQDMYMNDDKVMK
jgi:hypothetical protein